MRPDSPAYGPMRRPSWGALIAAAAGLAAWTLHLLWGARIAAAGLF